ncbi:MAG: Zn-dependent hydrolase [Haloferacaceae archaeon]
MTGGAFTDAVDEARIQRRIDEIAAIGGSDDGGVTRLAYSAEETEAFDYVRAELPDEYGTRTDSMGNLYASTDLDADRTRLVGSHLDSVYSGGRLDGVLGVVVALEALEVLATTGATPVVPPTLAVFRAEESARFGQHTIGSRGALGMLTTDDFACTDENDVPLWLAIQRTGFQPTDLSEPTLDLDRIERFFETHIEQGRVLDEADEALGVVTSIRAPVRHEVTVTGDYDHSGATPMDLRNDALAAAGELVVAVEEAATDADDVVATVGDITAHDGAINTVCGRVTFPLDVRSDAVDPRDEAESAIQERFAAVAERRGVDVSTTELDRSEPVDLAEAAVGDLVDAVDALDVPARRMPSGGGHDAMNLQQAGVPTGMLFVPSVDGVSHSPREETYPESIRAAAAAMAGALV